MKKNLFTFFLLTTNFFIYGQTIDENDIVWQVETEFEYQLENDSLLNFEYRSNNDEAFYTKSEIKTVKLDLTKHINYSYNGLRAFIIRSIEEGIFTAYTIEEDKKIPINKINEFLTSIDSTVTYHAETGEKKVRYFTNYFSTSDIQSFIIKQSWSFNPKNNKLYSKVLGIIPIVYRKGIKKQLFWIPLNNEPLKEPFNINKSNYTWIKLSENTISFNNAKVIKGKDSKWFEKTVLEKVRNGKITGLYPAGGNPFYEAPLSERELDLMLNPQIDTIIEFHPQTFEEKLTISEMEGIKATDIIGHRLFQYWFLDTENNTFNTQLITLGPVIKDKYRESSITIPFRINFNKPIKKGRF